MLKKRRKKHIVLLFLASFFLVTTTYSQTSPQNQPLCPENWRFFEIQTDPLCQNQQTTQLTKNYLQILQTLHENTLHKPQNQSQNNNDTDIQKKLLLQTQNTPHVTAQKIKSDLLQLQNCQIQLCNDIFTECIASSTLQTNKKTEFQETCTNVRTNLFAIATQKAKTTHHWNTKTQIYTLQSQTNTTFAQKFNAWVFIPLRQGVLHLRNFAQRVTALILNPRK